MDGHSREKLAIFFAVIAVISVVLAVSSGISSQRNKMKFQKEMVSRLDIEENLENSRFVVSALEEEIIKLQNQINSEKRTCGDVEKAVEEEKMMTQALKEELVKASKLNESLENSLKEALTGQASESGN